MSFFNRLILCKPNPNTQKYECIFFNRQGIQNLFPADLIMHGIIFLFK